MIIINYKNIRLLFLLVMMFAIPCFARMSELADSDSGERSMVNLLDSTHMVRALISQNRLADLLEEHNPEQLIALLDNISPAHMAFEIEVFSTLFPLVVVYYYIDSPSGRRFIDELNNIVVEYEDQIKFVYVDAERLYILTLDAEIATCPTILFVKNREIVERIEYEITIDVLRNKLTCY